MSVIDNTLASYNSGVNASAVMSSILSAQQKFNLSDDEIAKGLDAFGQWHRNRFGGNFDQYSSAAAISNGAIQNALNYKTTPWLYDTPWQNWEGSGPINGALNYAATPEQITAHRTDSINALIPVAQTWADAWKTSSTYSPYLFSGDQVKQLAALMNDYGVSTVGNLFNHYVASSWDAGAPQQWWGPEAFLSNLSTGVGADPAKYTNASLLQQQQNVIGQIGTAAQNSGGGDFFDSILPMIALGGLGLVTGGFGLAGLLGEGAAGLSAADAIAAAGGLEAGGAGVIGDLAATTAAGSGGAGGLSGVVDSIINAAPSIESLAQRAALNAAGQLITTGDIDPSKVLTSTLAGAAGTALGGAAGAAAGGGLTGSIVSGAVNGVTQAAITGADPLTAGLASAAASGLGSIAKDAGVPIPQSVVNSVVNSVATGAPLTSALTNAALSAGTDLVKGAISSNSSFVSPATPDVPTVSDNPSTPISWEDLQARFDQLTDSQKNQAWQMAQSTGDLNSAIDFVMTAALPPSTPTMTTAVTGLSGGSPTTGSLPSSTTSPSGATGSTGTTGSTGSGSTAANPYATTLLGFSPWLQPQVIKTPTKSNESDLFEGLTPQQSSLSYKPQQTNSGQYNYIPIEGSDVSEVPQLADGGSVDDAITRTNKEIADILASWNAKPTSDSNIRDYMNRQSLASSKLDFASFLRPNLIRGRAARPEPLFAGLQSPRGRAEGGSIDPSLADVLAKRNFPLRKEFVPGPEGHMYARHAERGFAVGGPGTGQSDDIPTMLSDGEYVIDADTVAALGDGSSKAGASILDKFRQEVRRHKRSAPADEIPPKAKSPMQYLKMAQKRK